MVPNYPTCDCKQARHGHGSYVMYTIHKCHCTECRKANRAYENHRIRQAAYGRSKFTPTVQVREHIDLLLNAGFGIRQIHKLSGVPQSTIGRIIYGRTERGEGPAKRILKTTEEKILAVKPVLENLAPSQIIDGTGTIRRLRALIAVGWSGPQIAARMGYSDTNFYHLVHSRERVYVSTALRVREVYDELWDQDPPQGTRFERAAVTRAKRTALALGWAPPMAWDDDRIDDPKYKVSKSVLRKEEANC